MDFGRLNPFRWNDKLAQISASTVYRIGTMYFCVNGAATCKMVNIDTGAETTMSATPVTWVINGQSLTVTCFFAITIPGSRYYLKLTQGATTKYSDYIEILGTDCLDTIILNNSCDTFSFPFTQAPYSYYISLPFPQLDAPTTESTYETLITENGERKKLISQTTRHSIWFVQPKWYRNVLASLSVSDSSTYRGNNIKNVEFTEEAIDEEMSQFTVSFEYEDLREGNDCCTVVNLDDIQNNEEGGGSECPGFSVTITESSGTLTPTIIGGSGGSVLYKWFKDGLFISSAPTLTVSQSGEYRVDVNDDGCRASGSYYIENVCNLMSVKVFSYLNWVTADISNIPAGCSPTIEVLLNGVVKSTTIPYEATESGVYFIKVKACDCQRSGAAFVNYSVENCNFSLSINRVSNVLQAVTDAVSPIYLWERETGSGIVTVGATANINISEKGIYWLTVTDGGCSQKEYIYLEPLAESGVFARYGGIGTSFQVLGINLLNIVDYAGQILVTVNGVEFSHVGGVPSAPNTYGVDGVTGNLLVPFSLSNPAIIIRKI